MIKSVALQAYNNALKDTRQLSQGIRERTVQKEPATGFDTMLEGSLGKVNELQTQKTQMIEEFASGKTQNVHELMITMQKAGLAMQMTSTVRGKIMQAYQEIMRMPF
ncbi:MAG: flagellar hook-basal body complex protein FliE [Desulfovibrionaceae bacterium]